MENNELYSTKVENNEEILKLAINKVEIPFIHSGKLEQNLEIKNEINNENEQSKLFGIFVDESIKLEAENDCIITKEMIEDKINVILEKNNSLEENVAQSINPTKISEVLDTQKEIVINVNLFCSNCKNKIFNNGILFSCNHWLCNHCLMLTIIKLIDSFQVIYSFIQLPILDINCINCNNGSVKISSRNILNLVKYRTLSKSHTLPHNNKIHGQVTGNIESEKIGIQIDPNLSFEWNNSNSMDCNNNYNDNLQFRIGKNYQNEILDDLTGVSDELKKLNIQEELPPCEACENNSYSIFCEDCNTYFCSDCLMNIHEKNRKNKGHSTINIINKRKIYNFCEECLINLNASLQVDEIKKCNKAEYFCMICDIEICFYCINKHIILHNESGGVEQEFITKAEYIHDDLINQLKNNFNKFEKLSNSKLFKDLAIQKKEKNEKYLKTIKDIVKKIGQFVLEMQKRLLYENKIMQTNIELISFIITNFKEQFKNIDTTESLKILISQSLNNCNTESNSNIGLNEVYSDKLKIKKLISLNKMISGGIFSYENMNEDTYLEICLENIKNSLEIFEFNTLNGMITDLQFNCMINSKVDIEMNTKPNVDLNEYKSEHFKDQIIIDRCINSNNGNQIYDNKLFNETVKFNEFSKYKENKSDNDKDRTQNLNENIIKYENENEQENDNNIELDNQNKSIKLIENINLNNKDLLSVDEEISNELDKTKCMNFTFHKEIHKIEEFNNSDLCNINLKSSHTFDGKLNELQYEKSEKVNQKSLNSLNIDNNSICLDDLANNLLDESLVCFKLDKFHTTSVIDNECEYIPKINEIIEIDEKNLNKEIIKSKSIEDKEIILESRNMILNANLNENIEMTKNSNIRFECFDALSIQEIYNDNNIQEPFDIKSNLLCLIRKKHSYLILPNKGYKLSILKLDKFGKMTKQNEIKTDLNERIIEIKYINNVLIIVSLTAIQLYEISEINNNNIEEDYSIEIKNINVIFTEFKISCASFMYSNNGLEIRPMLIIAFNQLNAPLRIINPFNNEKIKNVIILKNSIVTFIESFTLRLDKSFSNYIFAAEKKGLSVYDIEYNKLVKSFKTEDNINCIKIIDNSYFSYNNFDDEDNYISKDNKENYKSSKIVYSDYSGNIYVRDINNWQKYYVVNLSHIMNFPRDILIVNSYLDLFGNFKQLNLIIACNESKIVFLKLENESLNEFNIKHSFNFTEFLNLKSNNKCMGIDDVENSLNDNKICNESQSFQDYNNYSNVYLYNILFINNNIFSKDISNDNKDKILEKNKVEKMEDFESIQQRNSIICYCSNKSIYIYEL